MPGLGHSKYSEDFRLEVLIYARQHGNKRAYERFSVPEKTIRIWARARAEDDDIPTTNAENLQRQRVAIHEEAVALDRAGLKKKMLLRAHDLIERMDAPTDVVVNTKDGLEVERLKKPPAKDVQSLAVAFGIVVDKLRLESGEVTGRTEHVARDAMDVELEQLARDIQAKGKGAAAAAALHAPGFQAPASDARLTPTELAERRRRKG